MGEVRDEEDLLDFVENRMRMTGYYQPVIIRELLDAGGTMDREELAARVLLADPDTLDRAVRVLMRWPKATLTRHGVVTYDRRSRTFSLTVPIGDHARERIVAACTRKLAEWNRRVSPRLASARYAAIEAAGGRCQACGVTGSDRPLDVDHILPRSTARHGHVRHPQLGDIPVDGAANLQVLCSSCNRGKRDSGTYDFRPSEERLAETVRLTLATAERLGFDRETILRRARDVVA